MNPLTKVKLINELNEREAQLGVEEKVSWHSQYKDSAWIFLGGLPYELTEGDIICVFSQYGEVVNINLVRDQKTGKSKGFCFLCYEDQRSTILAVDNFNGIKIKGRTIRVDHVSNYRAPKDSEGLDDVTKQLQEKGCEDHMPSGSSAKDSEDDKPAKKHKKDKKEEEKKKKDKEKTNWEVQPKPSASSSSPRRKTLKEKDASDSKKPSSKNSEKGPKSESRKGRMQCHNYPEVRTDSRSGTEARAREPRNEQARYEYRSSSRKEARGEKDRDRDKDQSSDTYIDWHGGPFERNSHRSRSRSRSQGKSHRHSWSSWHSLDLRSPNSRDRRHR
ncbi:RNA-binding motif protein, X-linked 2-like [Suncus etruscus]|uniref:RNA-binding motif protein, X-linked 2-like n=1 Tax=Suncus etruscus TaxID=109475 RepID=UPI00210F2D78|nr:RNA-binding motif protein, X-linked 2-like [Suncus etruscus]